MWRKSKKKILPLAEQTPGTPTPTLFKKIFEGAATTQRRKKHDAVYPTSCADCCEIGGKVTHCRRNNFKIIINELLLTIKSTHKKIPFAYTNERWLLDFLAIINI